VAGSLGLAGLLWAPGPLARGAQASSGGNCQREPPRPALTSQLASRARFLIAFCMRHGRKSSRPSIESRAEEEGLEPPSAQRVETKPPRRWSNAGRTPPPAPQSKPVTPASRLVTHNAPLVAFRLGLRILAAGPAPQLTVLRSRTVVCSNPKFVATVMNQEFD